MHRQAELQELRRKLDCVQLRQMRNPGRGKPCLALFSLDQLLHRGLVTNCYEDKYSVFYIGYGNVELLDSHYIFEIPDELADIKLLASRVSLADSDDLEYLNGVAEAFASIAPAKFFKCEVVDVDHPRKGFLCDGMELRMEALIPFMNSAREFCLQLNPATVDTFMTQIDEISAQEKIGYSFASRSG